MTNMSEQLFLKLALDTREKQYDEMTATILDHVKPITSLLESRIQSTSSESIKVKWEDVGMNREGWMVLVATIPVTGDKLLRQQISLKLKPEVMEAIYDRDQLIRLIADIPVIGGDKVPVELDPTIDLEKNKLQQEQADREHYLFLKHQVSAIGFDVDNLEDKRQLTTDQLRTILYSHTTQHVDNSTH